MEVIQHRQSVTEEKYEVLFQVYGLLADRVGVALFLLGGETPALPAGAAVFLPG